MNFNIKKVNTKSITKWIKDNFVLFLIILFLILSFNLFKKLLSLVKGWFSSGEEESMKIESDKQVIDAVSVNTTKLPKGSSAYVTIANQLEDCMKDIGTDYSMMRDLLTPLNADELKQVYKEFGLRRYYVFGFEVAYGDLFVWFGHELSQWSVTGQSEMEEMRSIWSKANIW